MTGDALNGSIGKLTEALGEMVQEVLREERRQVNERLAGIEGFFDRIETKFNRFDERLKATELKINRIGDRFDRHLEEHP